MLDARITKIFSTIEDAEERRNALYALVWSQAESLFATGFSPAAAAKEIKSEIAHLRVNARIDLHRAVNDAWDAHLQERSNYAGLRALKTRTHADSLLETLRSFDEAQVFKVGIPTLDNAWGGVHPGEIGLIVGAPGSMKTSLVLGGVELYLRRKAGRVLFLSLDMSAQEIVRRRIQRRLDCTGFEVDRLVRGNSPQIGEALADIAETDGERFFLTDNSEKQHTLKDILGLIGTLAPQLLVVDFLTLLRAPGQTDLDAVNHTVPELKRAAQNNGIAVVLLSQMSRASRSEQAEGKSGGFAKGGGIAEELAHSELELLQDAPLSTGEPPRIVGTIAKTRRGVRDASYQLHYDGPSMTFTGSAVRVRRERPQKPVFSMDFEGPA